MRNVSLDQILSPKQLGEISTIIANAGDDEITQVRALKKYLAEHKEMLEAQGVVPEYLAYAIIYSRSTGRNATSDELLKYFGDLVGAKADVLKAKIKKVRKKGRR